MENVTPTLLLIWDVKRSLEKGTSVAKGIRFFIDRQLKDKFSDFVFKWFNQIQTTKESANEGTNRSLDISFLPATRRHLLLLLEMGLKGNAVLDSLKAYELEVLISCEDEIYNHTAKLPLLLMIPLMGLIFPALMLLLIGPTLKMLQL